MSAPDVELPRYVQTICSEQEAVVVYGALLALELAITVYEHRHNGQRCQVGKDANAELLAVVRGLRSHIAAAPGVDITELQRRFLAAAPPAVQAYFDSQFPPRRPDAPLV